MKVLKRTAAFALVFVLAASIIFYSSPRIAYADITVDATGSGATCSQSGCPTPYTWNHTVGAGLTNSLLAVCVISGGNTTVSGVTYASVSMTLATSSTNGTNIKAGVYYLVAPASGTNTVSVSYSGGNTTDVFVGGSVSLKDVSQTSTVDVQAYNKGTSVTTYTENITTAKDKDFLFDCFGTGGGFAVTPDATQTNITNGTTGGTAGTKSYGTSYKTALATPAGAKTMVWTAGIAMTFVGNVVAFCSTGSCDAAAPNSSKLAIVQGQLMIRPNGGQFKI